MEYQVPQFIEVEDKIFGPLTLKQFIYLAGGAGICVVLVLYLPRMLGFALALPIGGFSLALAFYRMNNKPFVEIVEAGFNYFLGNRLYLWKKVDQPAAARPVVQQTPAVDPNSGFSRSKLQELAWSLDVQDKTP